MTRRRFIIAALAVVVALGTVAAWVSRSFDTGALATASAWARLAPIPLSAHDRRVQSKGSMFCREFVITFVAPPGDVRQWLQASPGPSSAKRSVSGTATVYSITPGGGAEFAEVSVNEVTGEVTIRTYWS
jgi:CO/xanthine dehydrogenase Mo-binding subunit